MTDTPSYKLPETTYPERYAIRLTPDLTHFTFAGEESVTVTVKEPTQEIVLNACELIVHKVWIVDANGNTNEGSTTFDESAERAVLRFPRVLTPGEWQLHISFEGILNDKLRGFYRSSYKDADGQDTILASTQFESTAY